MRYSTPSLSMLLLSFFSSQEAVQAFQTHLPSATHRTTFLVLPSTKLHQSSNNKQDDEKIDVEFGDLIQPWKSTIPEEYRDEIYQAEANTPAAQQRSQRLTFYLVTAVLGTIFASANVFLTQLRDSVGSGSTEENLNQVMGDLGLEWVVGVPILGFLLLNKIGGGLALVLAGTTGTLAELEQRTKNENAEKIWKELQRRRAEGPKKQKNKSKTKSKSSTSASGLKKKQKQRNKQQKRLSALSEVIQEEAETASTATITTLESTSETKSAPSTEQSTNTKGEEEKEGGDGILGKLKGFYEKADSMAASQALLLNKELEDRGVIDKITDESGLKVIGKEEAANLQEKKQKKEEQEK